ncbi:MAG: hypothetical protein IJM54_05490 [Thermoguttaceae bacterium]|nr:hypothetical protein [Thermoguttaceae bacterium]
MSYIVKIIGAATFLLTVCVGCSQNVPVSGKVTFEDGAPLTKGTVFFDNGKISGKGLLQEDGSFKIGFEKEGNGIPKGDYNVYIMGAVEESAKESNSNDALGKGGGLSMNDIVVTNLIDPKYRSASTSGLTVSVTGKTTNCDFTVTRP